MQKQQATIRPQKNQESTQRPNRMPRPKQSIQQLCKSLLRHIWFPPYQKAAGQMPSSFCIMKHSMQRRGILNQPPRYALRTSSDFASSAPVPDRVMEPVSST